MRLWHQAILSALIFCSRSYGQFSPNITVVSCASRRVVIQVENAADGGLIFKQGSDSNCNQRTVSEKKNYEFDFELCNIEYDTKFRIVVQKEMQYQTGYDKVIPVMCIVDTSDLFVSGVVFPEEKLDSNLVNKTVRPSVSMRILASDNGKSLQEVSLNDRVRMSLKLDERYLDDFDIKVKDCRADVIDLIENECSANEELFPNFERKSRGDVAATFQAFKPTDPDGDSDADVAFTCTVAVCRGDCHKKLCGQIVGWGRKRRENEDDVDDVYEKVTCSTRITVKSPEKNFLDSVTSELKGKLCAEKIAVASVLAVTILTLIVSWTVCACVASKLSRVTRLTNGPEKPSALRRMSEKNINFARSVGRRLSTMLNLPVGYNIQDQKMMQECIPEAELSPTTARRRDSVTVSTDVVTDSNPYIKDHIIHSAADANPVILRKRFVDSGVQTESEPCPSVLPKEQKRSPLFARKQPFSFITSISIKSGLLKQKAENRDIPAPDAHDRDTHKPVSSFTSGSSNESFNFSVIDYTADNVPNVRNDFQSIESKKCDLDPFASDFTDLCLTRASTNLREPSLNDGYNDEFNTIPFENEVTDVEKEIRGQETVAKKNEASDIYTVTDAISDPIEIVASHKLTRKSSYHV